MAKKIEKEKRKSSSELRANPIAAAEMSRGTENGHVIRCALGHITVYPTVFKG
jgi:hypothetical protein